MSEEYKCRYLYIGISEEEAREYYGPGAFKSCGEALEAVNIEFDKMAEKWTINPRKYGHTAGRRQKII